MAFTVDQCRNITAMASRSFLSLTPNSNFSNDDAANICFLPIGIWGLEPESAATAMAYASVSGAIAMRTMMRRQEQAEQSIMNLLRRIIEIETNIKRMKGR